MIVALGKARRCREPNLWRQGGLTDLRDVMFCQKSLHESSRLRRRIVVMKLICSLGHCECDGHSTQAQSTASHCRLTSPTGETVHGCIVRSPLTGYHVKSGPRDYFSRYLKWTDTFRPALVLRLQVAPICGFGHNKIRRIEKANVQFCARGVRTRFIPVVAAVHTTHRIRRQVSHP